MALPEVPPLDAKRRVRRRKDNEVTFDARQRLHHMAGVDLTALEGIEETTALVVLSEIGTDMSRWPSEKPFGSWLGLEPNPKKSGGKVKSSATRRGLAKAITATAYKLARIIYALLQYGTAYVAQGLEAYERANQARVVRQLKRKARELGLVLVKRDAYAHSS